jgi:hypothetical protein
MPPKKNISPAGYAFISFISLLIGIGLLLLFIYKADAIIGAGISNKIFYILLIPLALASAGFLFGGMKSYATYKGQALGGALELGGPVVLFCLVLVGGFKLVPADEAPFNIMIYFEDLNGNSIKPKDGEISLLLKNDIRKESIANQQNVDFKNISQEYRLQNVEIEINSENWVFENNINKTNILLDKVKHTLKIKLINKCLEFSGSISKKGAPLFNVKVQMDTLTTYTNEQGEFKLNFPSSFTNTTYSLRLSHSAIGVIEQQIAPCTNNKMDLVL